jgi:hypothetical protein
MQAGRSFKQAIFPSKRGEISKNGSRTNYSNSKEICLELMEKINAFTMLSNLDGTEATNNQVDSP